MSKADPDGQADGGNLDPADWEAFRALCHRAVDDSIEYLRTVRERPVWRPVPESVKAQLSEGPPLRPTALDAVYDEFLQAIRPYPTGNIHPRFFGWVHGTGTPGGALAEFLAAVMNANVGGREHAAVYVERQVVSWFRDIFGLPASAGGLLLSGTSMANLLALGVARNAALQGRGRMEGMGPLGEDLRVYTSTSTHGSVAKAMEVLGLGQGRLRTIAAIEGGAIDIGALARAISEDRAQGLRPFCVVATAGAVNTGAIDDLCAIADICARESLWMHVDGAFGGLAILSDRLRSRLTGIERADSIAFDFHKWVHVPYDAGCLLVRNASDQLETFASSQDYLTRAEQGLAAGAPWFCDFGVELSRGFRALKVWFTLKEHGVERIGAKIADNCDQASSLARQVSSDPSLQLLAPVALNIVCFRCVAEGLDEAGLDALNVAVIELLQNEGVAAPSMTRVGGRVAIRVNITNHRTRASDLDILLQAVRQGARRLLAQPGNEAPPPASS